MIYFLRHGESIANVNNVFAGQKDDTPLTEHGRLQARDAAKEIQSTIKINRIIASPLVRTKETAEIIANVIEFPIKNIEFDKRIVEYDMGEITGSPIRKVTSKELTSAKGAEDPSRFQDRVLNLLKELDLHQGNILIVSHAGVGRIIEAYKRQIDPLEFYDIEPYPNAHITKLDIL